MQVPGAVAARSEAEPDEEDRLVRVVGTQEDEVTSTYRAAVRGELPSALPAVIEHDRTGAADR